MLRRLPAWLPYVLPLAVFLAFTTVESNFGPHSYPLLYLLKIACVGMMLIVFARAGCYPEVVSDARLLLPGLGLGIVLCAMWLGVDRVTPHFAFLGRRAAYDPFTAIHGDLARDGFLAVRFLGLVVVAPWMEELFYRSFLLRFVVDMSDFRAVPTGRFDPLSFGFAVVIMALGHVEWLAAALFSAAMNLLLYRTKSVFACILTHAATNLALGLYVVWAHAWVYW